MKHHSLVAFACAAALTVGCNSRVRTDTTTGAAGTSGAYTGAVSDRDTKFINNTLSAGMAEVETAKLARDRALNPEVKQFAQMMIDDHTKAGELLMGVASNYAIPQQAKVDDAHLGLMDKLSKLQGAAFDSAYINAMIDDHETAVGDLRARVDEKRSLSERLEGKNPEDRTAVQPEPSDDRATMSINEWAANTLPTVEHHLDRAKEIKDLLDHPNATAHR